MYQVFSDESFSNRYQAVGVISGEAGVLLELRIKLQNILHDTGVSEVKFEEVRTHLPKIKAAHTFLKEAVMDAKQNKIRVDVVTWDIYDTRHSIPDRDDVANLTRMYYKLLRHVSEQWNQQNWAFYPDENTYVDWTDTIDYLNATKTPRRKPHLLRLFDEDQYLLNFTGVQPLNSENEPLIQLSDLFAGMARFVRECGEECLRWLGSQRLSKQPLLFNCNEHEVTDDPIKAKCNRFVLVNEFYNLCRDSRLGVSLNTKKYFWTRSPRNPVNFWNYEPQYEDDKAPSRFDREQP